MKADKLLKLILQLEAAVLILALPAMFLPVCWMAGAHQWLGLGTMPEGKLVEYLTRSLSLLYAAWAPILLFVSLDVVKYTSLIKLLSWIRIVIGLALLGIDLHVGMPWFWTINEGPMIAVISAVQLWLAHRIGTADGPA